MRAWMAFVLAAAFLTGCPAPYTDGREDGDTGGATDGPPEDVPMGTDLGPPPTIDEGPADPGPGIPDARYDLGTPMLTELYVSPAGDDATTNPGTSMTMPLRSLPAAWARTMDLSRTGYRINLLPGMYGASTSERQIRLQDRTGTRERPIVLRSTMPAMHAVVTTELSFVNVAYVYLMDLDVQVTEGDDALHCERCQHFLLRNVRLAGRNAEGGNQETLKVNQSQYIYVEDSDISGAWDNPVDYVAVQYGHIVHSRIHDGGDWCAYMKGGSAYQLVEGNEIDHCNLEGTAGGFTAGQGSGFEWMVSPWLHYEAYDIKAVNNVIHDTGGAGLGVFGGYNILYDHNTLYRVALHTEGGPSAIEIVHGRRGCDGHADECGMRLMSGGWGVTGEEEQIVPSRNVYLYNNLIYLTAPTRDQTFAIAHATMPATATNIPSPSLADENLRIRGNLIWDGGPSRPVAEILGGSEGCAQYGQGATCNVAGLLRDNVINRVEPQLVDPAHGDFHPRAGGNVTTTRGIAPGSFAWRDLPSRPATAPMGTLTNTLRFNREGAMRPVPDRPGAY